MKNTQEKQNNSEYMLNELFIKLESEKDKVKKLFNKQQLAIIYYVGFNNYSAKQVGKELKYSPRTIETRENDIFNIIQNNYEEFSKCNYTPKKLIKTFWAEYEYPIRYALFNGVGVDVLNKRAEFIAKLETNIIIEQMKI